jgi:hypothetical protein
VLSDDSVKSYLEADELTAFFYMKRKWSHAHSADLLRVLLLKKYGGVWMDATNIPTESQEDVLTEYGLIDTNHTTESQRKDVLVFSIGRHEEGFDQRGPVIENWYMAARKNALYIDRWLTKSLEFWMKVDLEVGGKNRPTEAFLEHFQPFFQKQGFSAGSKGQQNFGVYLLQHWASLWIVQEERIRWMDWFWQHFGQKGPGKTFLQSTNDQSPQAAAFPVGDNNAIDLLRWTNKIPSSYEEFSNDLRWANPGITVSFRLKILDCAEGPFRLHFFDDLWGNSHRWVTKDSNAKWHTTGIPRHFVKLTGSQRKEIEEAIKEHGVDAESLVANLLPGIKWE